MMSRLKYYSDEYPVTICLIAISVMLYILSLVLFNTLEMDVEQGLMLGAYNPLYVSYNHEYYRILVSNFIHFGPIHLFVNCYSLFGLGSLIEKVLSHKSMLLICLSSAICTSGLQYLLFLMNHTTGVTTVSAGISGVIFGLFGCVGALYLFYKDTFRDLFKSLLVNVITMMAISLLIPQISFLGHLCGLIGGFISSCIIIYYLKKKNIYR